MKKPLIVLVVCVLIWFVFVKEEQVELGPGVRAPEQPQQSDVSKRSFQHEGYRITPLADFSIKAKVLSRLDYRMGREADLAPVDLALGWGRMSDESILESIKIWQSNRWYRWRVEAFPIPRREIETSSANMHLVPASDSVKSAIKKSRKGDIIELTGYLIRADAPDGWHWVSSLTRKDTGARSCEVIWVESFKVHTR